MRIFQLFMDIWRLFSEHKYVRTFILSFFNAQSTLTLIIPVRRVGDIDERWISYGYSIVVESTWT